MAARPPWSRSKRTGQRTPAGPRNWRSPLPPSSSSIILRSRTGPRPGWTAPGGRHGISLGRLRPDTQYDYKFVGLSHNTLRGAAGGGVLLAELLCAEGYITKD